MSLSNGSQKRKRPEFNEDIQEPKNEKEFLSELSKNLADFRISNQIYKNINRTHTELLLKNKLVSCQKFAGRLFSTQKEKIFSEPFQHMLGASQQNIIENVEGLELRDNLIYDSFARKALCQQTPEIDEPLPFRRNCKWAVGYSIIDKPVKAWKYHVKQWFRSEKHQQSVQIVKSKLQSLTAKNEIDEKSTRINSLQHTKS